MNTDSAAPGSRSQNALEEYHSLRDETAKRQDAQSQILSYTLLFAASMLTLGLGDKPFHSALLVYPIVSFFFAVGFSYNALMLIEIGAYIRTVERTMTGLGWAAYLKGRYGRIELFETVSTAGLFAGTQLISLVLFSSLGLSLTRTEAVVRDVAWVALVATVCAIMYPKSYHRRVLRDDAGPA
ncbi:MAG TPA: hypothetical protein VIW69_06875 [Candidatus Elarobacter sp.]